MNANISCEYKSDSSGFSAKKVPLGVPPIDRNIILICIDLEHLEEQSFSRLLIQQLR